MELKKFHIIIGTVIGRIYLRKREQICKFVHLQKIQ